MRRSDYSDRLRLFKTREIKSRALGMMATDFGSIRRMNSSSCGLIIDYSPGYVQLRLCALIVPEGLPAPETSKATATGQTGFSEYAQRQNRGAVATGSKQLEHSTGIVGLVRLSDSLNTLNVRTEER